MIQRYLRSPFIDLADGIKIADQRGSRSRDDVPRRLPIRCRLHLRQAARSASSLLRFSNQTYAISRADRHFACASQLAARSLLPSPEEWTVSDGLLPAQGLLIFIPFEKRHGE